MNNKKHKTFAMALSRSLNDQLLTACWAGDLDTVQKVCQAATSQILLCSSDIEYALYFAARGEHKPIVEYLCELDLSLPALPLTGSQFGAYYQGVVWAARSDVLSVMRFLCELALSRPALGLTLAFGGQLPLLCAVERGSTSVVSYLCELAQSCPCLGIDLAAKNNYCIRHAAAIGRADMVRLLCEQPTVDPAAVLCMDMDMDPQPPADILEIVCDALAQRQRWSSLRAAWVGAAVTAGANF